MPGTAKQARTAGMALACKRGKKKACKGPAKKMAQLSEKILKEFMVKK